ncbi:recombinase family protein [Collimonas sp. OK607]|uniref:recombinase family protein n=1 Tax=Collimonas sp. OK607 TaxID=1798194 RepID=UPI001113E1B2|nr:recombinase family protein [Collimonas sp. OK607]
MKAKDMNAGQFLLQQLLSFSETQIRNNSRQTFKSGGGNISGEHAVLPAERPYLLKWIADRRSYGDTFSSIAASLNAQGLRGGNGARWYSASVYHYLHRHSRKAASASSEALVISTNGTTLPAWKCRSTGMGQSEV